MMKRPRVRCNYSHHLIQPAQLHHRQGKHQLHRCNGASNSGTTIAATSRAFSALKYAIVSTTMPKGKMGFTYTYVNYSWSYWLLHHAPCSTKRHWQTVAWFGVHWRYVGCSYNQLTIARHPIVVILVHPSTSSAIHIMATDLNIRHSMTSQCRHISLY